MKLKRTALAVAALGALLAAPAHASLVLAGAENFQGTGLGNVNTILTITSPGNGTFEQGSVGRSSPGNVFTSSGDLVASNQTRTLTELGVTSAANLRVVFNALEPGQAANGITLSNLVLNIYSPTGGLLFNSGAFTPVTFADSFTGAGNSGFVFRLDATQAASAQTLAFGGNFGLNQVGLTAAAGCVGTQSATCMAATGGLETFFVANTPGSVVTPIPEPETYALMMAGLGAVGFMARRRKQKQS